ncbi:hypothetical protein PTKIN_Ptkin14bG0044900 [Pterospermum kingtungense]
MGSNPHKRNKGQFQDGQQTKGKNNKKKVRKARKGVNKLIYGEFPQNLELSQCPVSDIDIAWRNQAILHESEVNWDVGSALGFKYLNSRVQIVEFFEGMEGGEVGRVQSCFVWERLLMLVMKFFPLFPMKIANWNIKALGGAEKRRVVRKLLCEAVNSIGNSRGLISCWRDEFFELESKVVSQSFIFLMGSVKSCNFRCGFGNVYAPNDDNERRDFQEEIQSIIRRSGLPWRLAGDFNVVRYPEEKIGMSYNQIAMDSFLILLKGWVSLTCLCLVVSSRGAVIDPFQRSVV